MTLPFFACTRETSCTIDIEHSERALHAHVELDDESDLNPGDKVRVHGEAISVRFGERLKLRRPATVVRAGLIERVWTRLAARFELTELFEVSFTPRRLR